ncbi:MAG: cysteine hydrolase family protein [Sneathiella sp.]
MPNTALILIDIQNDYFENGSWPVHQMQQAANNAAKLLENARSNGTTVIHIRHEIPSEQAPFFRPGTPGAAIHVSVAPKDGETVILKHKPNSFKNTTLLEDLKNADIENVTICGAMSQMCVDATTRAAADFDFNVTVVEDACGAKEQEFNGEIVPAPMVHAAIMAPLAMSYAKVVSTSEFLSNG